MSKFEMTYGERESLKRFAGGGKCLHAALTMIAHWMRQVHPVSFSEYASQWAAAEQREDVQAIRDQWPLVGPRKIADNCSEWGTYSESGAPPSDADLNARAMTQLLKESRADWKSFVPATKHMDKWVEWFADLLPDANPAEWRIDIERGIAYGPGGEILVS